MQSTLVNAVILAAGKGNRLDRHNNPKPLVKVGDKPMILHVIEHMQDAGITHIHIVIGHRGEEIKKELTNNKCVTAHITYVNQNDSSVHALLKSLLMLRGTLHEPFFVSMADLVMEHNPFSTMADIKRVDTKLLLYSLIGVDSSKFKRTGALSRACVEGEHVTNIGRDLSKFDGLEVGVYYFPKDALQGLYKLSLRSGIKDFGALLTYLAKKRKLGWKPLLGGEWFDINTPSTHVRANMFVRERNRPVPAAKERREMSSPKQFSSFARTKIMITNIVLERGILDHLGSVRIIPESRAVSTHFILTDSVLDSLYGKRVFEGLTHAGYDVKKLVIPAGEASKSIATYTRLADGIFSYGLDKKSTIISLGGGVVNNIAGVLAGTLYRGIHLIHLPTSMMAQVDAAIDFKQAINSTSGKNLIGSYYPASFVVIDPNVLETLEERHIRNGIAESIKHAITQDKVFFKRLLHGAQRIHDIDFLEFVIKKTLELKVPLLNGDTDDDFNEMLPQYGHSVGHAIEHLSSYELLHGEAISIGGCVSAEIAGLLGIAEGKVVQEHYEIAKKFKLPSIVPEEITSEHICEMIRFDKHYEGDFPHMALPQKIGDMWQDKGVYGAPIDFEILGRAIENNKKKKKKYGR